MAAALCTAALLFGAADAGAQQRVRCDVTFNLGALPGGFDLGAADFVVQYERPKIFWRDPENKVKCVGLPEGSAVAASDELLGPTEGELTIAYSSATGVTSGTPLVRCDVYVPDGSEPEPDDFPAITVTQASTAAGAAIDPVPVILVGQTRCGDVTTTTSTTTTTANPTLTTTTTTLVPEICSVLFHLDTAGSFRRILLDVDFSAAGGHLADDAEVACHNQTAATLNVSENEAEQSVLFNLVSVTPFTGPRDLVECDFIPTHFLATADQFGVDVTAANNSSGAAIPPGQLPTASASNVMCPSLTTTTTLAPTTTLDTTTTTTTAAPAVCGDADGNGQVQASDALAALREAVGLTSPCTPVRCDTDDNGTIQATDSLRILRAAVGSEVTLDCPA